MWIDKSSSEIEVNESNTFMIHDDGSIIQIILVFVKKYTKKVRYANTEMLTELSYQDLFIFPVNIRKYFKYHY